MVDLSKPCRNYGFTTPYFKVVWENFLFPFPCLFCTPEGDFCNKLMLNLSLDSLVISSCYFVYYCFCSTEFKQLSRQRKNTTRRQEVLPLWEYDIVLFIIAELLVFNYFKGMCIYYFCCLHCQGI